MVEVGRLEGGDLAGVVAGVALLRPRDAQGVTVGLLHEREALVLLDHLLAHGDDGLVSHPQQDKALWN